MNANTQRELELECRLSPLQCPAETSSITASHLIADHTQTAEELTEMCASQM